MLGKVVTLNNVIQNPLRNQILDFEDYCIYPYRNFNRDLRKYFGFLAFSASSPL